MSEHEPITYLQVPCAICGRLTDLPSVWTCACGQYRLCYRSPCYWTIPNSHCDVTCAVAKQETTEGRKGSGPQSNSRLLIAFHLELDRSARHAHAAETLAGVFGPLGGRGDSCLVAGRQFV